MIHVCLEPVIKWEFQWHPQSWDLGILVFVERGKPERGLGESPDLIGAGTRTNDKLNPHTSTPGIEHGPHWWEASDLNCAIPANTAGQYLARNEPA